MQTQFDDYFSSLKGKNIVVLGLGVSNRPLVRLLLSYGCSAEAFRLMFDTGLLGDLLPDLSKHIASSGGCRSAVFKYLEGLDAYEKMMTEKGFEVSNALRAAVLMTGLYKAEKKEGAGRRVMQMMSDSLKIPKAVYFTAVSLMESTRRLSSPPAKGKIRYIYSRDFLDALDYNRIVARAEKSSEDALNQWADLYEEKYEEKGQQE